MKIQLQVDGQFGDDGPQKGDEGACALIMKDQDGDYWAICLFEDYDGLFNVKLENLLTADTSNTETFYTTIPNQED